MTCKIENEQLDLSKFPFDRIAFEVHENNLVVKLLLKNVLLKTWTSYTGVPIGSSLTIHGVDGTVDLTEKSW